MRIAIYKYGVGNIYSVQSALKALGAETTVLEKLDTPLDSYDALILPGVGNFGAAARRLEGEEGQRIKDYTRQGGALLGICLGLHLLYEKSDEAPLRKGLGLLKGRIRRIPAPKLPHIGWTPIHPQGDSALLEGIRPGEYFYFVHSYAQLETQENNIKATSQYQGTSFASLIENPPIYATQFHPERSGKPGRKLLTNFIKTLKK